TPSFKVDQGKNLWVDYGDGNAGGTLIDLVLKMNPSFGISEAIKEISKISGHSFSFHQQTTPPPLSTKKESPAISILKIKPLGNNRAITDYLHSRSISLETAKKFCREVYYSIGDKRYFGLGNKHENGWAIRNKYWKGCTAQGVSHYRNNSADLCLFEGIFDLLSYVEMKKGDQVPEDFMVLNSLSNLKGSITEINKYGFVELFLDRDQAGKEATDMLRQSIPNCQDQGDFIRPFKDLNEFWMNGLKQAVKR
ncbi:MAG: toprim domain-containing protein, partial [Anditalea sp.]